MNDWSDPSEHDINAMVVDLLMRVHANQDSMEKLLKLVQTHDATVAHLLFRLMKDPDRIMKALVILTENKSEDL